MTYDELRRAAFAVAERTGRGGHRAALVLGSGLSDYAEQLPDAVTVPYAAIPGFPVPRVEGHRGTLVSAVVGGLPVLVLAGRVHAYEGWDLDAVVFAVRTVALAGCETVILTNAAGAVAAHLAPGDLVAITDHLNLTGRNPLTGDNDARLGPRFPDMTEVYGAGVRRTMHDAADRAGVDLAEGVYAWFAGPSYETPAEVEMACRLGADLVGMSTVPEAIALRHMGIRVGGLSLVTNAAAGVAGVPLSHDEVTAAASAARDRMGRYLNELLAALAATA